MTFSGGEPVQDAPYERPDKNQSRTFWLLPHVSVTAPFEEKTGSKLVQSKGGELMIGRGLIFVPHGVC